MFDENKWKNIVSKVDFAFQPIVNINTGETYGVEALLREYKNGGFSTINDFFDTAYIDKMLYKVELMLREKAIEKFKKIRNFSNLRLFINIDNRLLEMPDYSSGNTQKILREKGVNENMICFEISERHEIKAFVEMKGILNIYKQQQFKIAIDDFGTGFAGLEMLYHCEPNFIKIDRFFISGIENDYKKRLFISNIVNMAHTLGIKVIAEGVEKREEFYVCREIGCDYVQGYIVQHPTQDVSAIEEYNKETIILLREDKRAKRAEENLIAENIERVESICYKTDISRVFDIFKANKEFSFFPVVNEENEPLGIIRERDIKDYIFSPYGKEVLKKRIAEKSLSDFITSCQIADINTKLEIILETASNEEKSEGIIVTDGGKYEGFLTSQKLLKIIYDKKLIDARDQNPLTKMNGNIKIESYIANICSIENGSIYILCYFDFDNFKPFNDKYGFRQGDRAIILFSEILNRCFRGRNVFKGHIGGDDFFLGFELKNYNETEVIYKVIKEIREIFMDDAAHFYEQKDRERGYMTARDRDGKKRKIPLLSVSAAVITLHSDRYIEADELTGELMKLKKTSKSKKGGIAFASLVRGK